MADLSYLFQNSAPQSVTGSTTSSASVPDWLADYNRGIAAKATSIAGQGYQPYPDARLADFNSNQTSAFQNVQNNQGNWQPALDAATTAASGISANANARLAQGAQYGAGALDAVTGAAGNANGIAGMAGANANGAVAGPAQSWTNNWQQYMSPYTDSVVNEIGRLGNQNLQENILPSVQNSFLGAGQFGSTRNADILGRAVRDAQTNITGQQSQALQSGYGTAANIFGTDANRAQQQQQLQSTTALNAGQLGANTALTGGQAIGSTGINAGQLANSAAGIGVNADSTQAAQLGALASMRQTLGTNDANSLLGVGNQQQQLTQQGLNTSYQDFLNQRDWDKNNLSYLNSVVKGVPNNTTSTAIQNTPSSTFGNSPSQWIGALSQLS